MSTRRGESPGFGSIVGFREFKPIYGAITYTTSMQPETLAVRKFGGLASKTL